MAEMILPGSNPQSLFDSIRHYDEKGNEYWLGRDLMPLLEYAKWQRFEDAITRAMASCEAAGCTTGKHFIHLPGSVSGKGRLGDNYKLSRYAAYLVAMNGDIRKPAIAQAQAYFAIKTREAETVIPRQSEEVERLKLAIEYERTKGANIDRINMLTSMHGAPTALVLLGRSNDVLEIEKPLLEVIDEQHNVKFKGQTLKQVADYVAKRYGIKIKSGADVARILKRHKRDDLIAQTKRSVLSDYIPEEFLDEVYRILNGGDRQMLLGE